jgi:hypothetical protein
MIKKVIQVPIDEELLAARIDCPRSNIGLEQS